MTNYSFKSYFIEYISNWTQTKTLIICKSKAEGWHVTQSSHCFYVFIFYCKVKHSFLSKASSIITRSSLLPHLWHSNEYLAIECLAISFQHTLQWCYIPALASTWPYQCVRWDLMFACSVCGGCPWSVLGGLQAIVAVEN